MRRLALIAIGVALAAACSSFDGENPTATTPDGGTPPIEAGATTSLEGGTAALCNDPAKCPARPLALKVTQLFGLTADADYIYAGSEGGVGKIYRIAKSDGAVITLAEGKGDNAKLPVLHGDDVYFATDTGVYRVPKKGGGAVQVSPVKQTALTFDGDQLYGCRYQGPFDLADVVRVLAADGGTVKYESVAGCESLASNGTYLLYGGSGSIGRARLDGNDTPVVLGRYAARRVVADGNHVYSTAYLDGEVRRIAIDGAAANTAFETIAKYNELNTELGDLTVDATHVYWTIGRPGGKVFRAPKAGGPPELIADNFAYPVGIVVDDRAIYWSERDKDILWTRQK